MAWKLRLSLPVGAEHDDTAPEVREAEGLNLVKGGSCRCNNPERRLALVIFL